MSEMTAELQKLKITSRGPTTTDVKIMLGDEDIAGVVGSAYITMIAGKQITVDLELAVPSGVDFDVNAKVDLGYETREFLIGLGWEPPKE
jgi:hypothetical protein